MSNFIRWIIVDDTSSDINYLGRSWFSNVGSWDSAGSHGIPYLSTLHGTNGNASFAFNFTGSAVSVVGSTAGSSSLYWTCSLDGVDTVMTSTVYEGPSRNNFVFCYVNSLADEPHTLTVNAIATGNQTFWLDRIEYVPSQQVSLEQKAIGVALGGPGLDSSALTVFVYTFYGVSVSWYGTIFTSNPGNLSWSMDHADVNYISNWSDPTVSNASYPKSNQKFFETPTYPIGVHTLKVAHIATRSNVQLRFNYLVVQNGSKSASESSTPHSSATGSTVTSGISGPVISGIIGGVIGGVLVFCVALAFYFCRRRFKAKRRIEIYSDKPIPFTQKPSSPSPQTHPVQRKSPILTIRSRPNTTNLPPSCRTNSMNEPSSAPSTGPSAYHIGDHGRPRTMCSSAQQNVDVRQSSSLVPGSLRIIVHQDSGIRLNRGAVATPVQ